MDCWKRHLCDAKKSTVPLITFPKDSMANDHCLWCPLQLRCLLLRKPRRQDNFPLSNSVYASSAKFSIDPRTYIYIFVSTYTIRRWTTLQKLLILNILGRASKNKARHLPPVRVLFFLRYNLSLSAWLTTIKARSFPMQHHEQKSRGPVGQQGEKVFVSLGRNFDTERNLTSRIPRIFYALHI